MSVCHAPVPIVFDLDGTLIDSAPDIHACVNTVLDGHDVPGLTLDEVRSFIGGGVEVLWRKIGAARRLPDDRAADYIAAFMECYHTANGLTRVFPGVVTALNTLAERGHSLGICTNKPHSVTSAILDHLDLMPMFGVVIGGDSLPERKPHPAPLRAALHALGAHPETPEGFYVGDSEFDASCAAAVPIPFLIYSEGYRQTPVSQLPHLASFDDFSALPRLIAKQISA